MQRVKFRKAIAGLVPLWLLLAAAVSASASHAAGPRIVVYSASLATAYRLPKSQGLVPQLQNALDRRGVKAQLINVSRAGRTTRAGVRAFGRALRQKPDGFILALGGNDILRGYRVSETKRNLETMLKQLKRRGIPVLLVAIDANRFRPAKRRQFAAAYRDLSRKYGTQLHRDFFAPLRNRPDRLLRDRIHPNAKGVRAMVADILPAVTRLVKRSRAR